MPLTVLITRDVEDRYRGFLGSAMLELAPGVYAQPRMSAGVRGRIWGVVEEWYAQLRRGSVVMCWAEASAPGGLGLSSVGEPPKHIVAHDAVLLVRRLRPLAMAADGGAGGDEAGGGEAGGGAGGGGD